MKATSNIVSKTHDDWLASRRGGIGSSEVATILGLNAYDTPYQLWLRKTGRIQEVEQETKDMRRGHLLEDGVARFVSEEAGLDIVKSSVSEFVVVDREKPYFRASPDRYAFPRGAKRSDDNRVIIECKTHRGAIDPDADLSDYWLVQVSWQLGVSRTNMAYIGWLTGGFDFGYRPIVFDADFFAYLSEEVERFWVDCVLGGREPDLTTLTDVLIKFPRHTEGKKVWAKDELLQAWADLKDTKARLKEETTRKEALEEIIKKGMLDAEVLALPASDGVAEKPLATWKAGKPKEVFDVDHFRTDNPELYAKYLVTKEGSRTFLLK